LVTFLGNAIVNMNITCFVSETDTAFAHGSQAPKQQQSRDPFPSVPNKQICIVISSGSSKAIQLEIIFIPLFSPPGCNFHS